MNKFKKPYASRTSNGRPPSRTQSRGGSFRRPEAVQLFDATCSNCGNKCQVPFRPSGTKPVYCKNCFGTPREASSTSKRSSAIHPITTGPVENGGSKSIAELTRQVAAMNTKIDLMLRILADNGSEK